MKKNFKLVLALVLSILLVASSVAFAADGDITITINKPGNDTAKHTYNAYQIFKGTSNPTGGSDPVDPKVENITWGAAINSATLQSAFITALKGAFSSVTAVNDLTTTSTAGVVAAAINAIGASDDDSNAQKLAEVVNKFIVDNTIAETANSGEVNFASASSASITIPAATGNGYFFIKDASAPDGKNGAQTRFILEVIGNTTISAKASVPSVSKTVNDVNDSEPTTAGKNGQNQTSADYDVGDKVPFTITATTSSKTDEYYKYHITIQDKQSAGLNNPEKFTIAAFGQNFYLDFAGDFYTDSTFETKITATDTKKDVRDLGAVTLTVQKVAPATGNTFAIKFTLENETSTSAAPVRIGNADVVDTKNIVVSYESELNQNADMGNPGNVNETYLQYSNNPNSTDDSDEGETPKKYTKIFTYKTTVNKKDEDGSTPLKGAAFTLYKEVPSTFANAQTGATIKASYTTDAIKTAAAKLDNAKYYVSVGFHDAFDANTTTFDFKGLDDGTYVLVETTVPNGYNPFLAVEFTIDATHEDSGNGTSADAITLTALTGTDSNTTNGQTFTSDLAEGSLSTNVTNKTGVTLPSTGGIGTTIFYVGGSILVLAAAILLITKRRMSNND